MSTNAGSKAEIDRYLVIHVATTCDEHGVYVTKDSAEVIEIGWLLLDAKNCEEVRWYAAPLIPIWTDGRNCRFTARVSWSSRSTPL